MIDRVMRKIAKQPLSGVPPRPGGARMFHSAVDRLIVGIDGDRFPQYNRHSVECGGRYQKPYIRCPVSTRRSRLRVLTRDRWAHGQSSSYTVSRIIKGSFQYIHAQTRSKKKPRNFSVSYSNGEHENAN